MCVCVSGLTSSVGDDGLAGTATSSAGSAISSNLGRVAGIHLNFPCSPFGVVGQLDCVGRGPLDGLGGGEYRGFVGTKSCGGCQIGSGLPDEVGSCSSTDAKMDPFIGGGGGPLNGNETPSNSESADDMP